ncbi:acidic mammalian chitinase-like isoform X2 [Dunckerocampus dactyliophorus]|uniref:acidic mammalian chitinase-like isoform X2 n=1 Tax=Dunckerocampus dactyliophorus TaxID=161453 RepID=UPI0024058372|nr:acidic mammalian chitinase-like isoform X2 [Dunckerocampus dactyliophorus]
MHKLILLAGATKRLVCHYDSASVQNRGPGHFKISDIDPTLCSHLVYSFVAIDNFGKLGIIPGDIPQFYAFNALKNSNPQLKTLLEVNLMLNFPALHTMISTPNGRSSFIGSAIDAVQEYGFDGLNVFWMNRMNYPTLNPQLFSELIMELRAAFEGLLLTASISAVESVIDGSYDVHTIANNVDFLNVMTAGIDINFMSQPSDTGFERTISAAAYLASNGAPQNKLNLGIAAYGRAFAETLGLSEPDKTKPLQGYLTDRPGLWTYYEVCHHLSESTSQIANAFVGYDSLPTIVAKADFINNHAGGAFVMSINLDDFSGNYCGLGNYPVIQTLHDELTTLPASR